MKLILIILIAILGVACKKKEDPTPVKKESNWKVELINTDSSSVTVRYFNNLDPLNYLDPLHRDSLDLVIPALSTGYVDYSKHHGEESYFIVFHYRVLGKTLKTKKNIYYNKENIIYL